MLTVLPKSRAQLQAVGMSRCGWRWVCWCLHVHLTEHFLGPGCMAVRWLGARAGLGLPSGIHRPVGGESQTVSGSPVEGCIRACSHRPSLTLSPSLPLCFYLWHLKKIGYAFIRFKINSVWICERSLSSTPLSLPTLFLFPLCNDLYFPLGIRLRYHYINTSKYGYIFLSSPSFFDKR